MDKNGRLTSLLQTLVIVLFLMTRCVTSQDGEMTWVISSELCQVSNCSCPNTFQIKCQCQPNLQQIMNLDKPIELNTFITTPLTLEIENCAHLRIGRNAFAGVNGNNFSLHLSNIPQLELMESAFELNSGISSRILIFKNVNVKEIPKKSFPTSLNIINFINSSIGVISSEAFKGKTLQQIKFTDTRIGLIKSNAFDEDILINNSWIVKQCIIGTIEKYGIQASIVNMSWIDSDIGNLGSYSMSGTIPNASFLRNRFRQVSTNGLTLREWTRLTFLNNTFDKVDGNGIDLTQHSDQVNTSHLIGNTWNEIGEDFIKVGMTYSIPYIQIEANRILQQCNCSTSLFIPEIVLDSSSLKFQEQIQNNSQCLTTSKGASCLGRSDPETDLFISYEDRQNLCSEIVYLCLHELDEVTNDESTVLASPSLTGRLRILAIFIGTIGLAIVVVLLGVLCVYLCRKDKSIETEKQNPQRSKSIRVNGHLLSTNSNPIEHSYNGILSNKVPYINHIRNNPGGLVMRPRSTLFEDVEMEDKGVQTMPNELSSEVLDGLREKLTDPESFLDAKETIDHLYDLIHVREEAQSSPPDVTVLSSNNNASNQIRQTKETSTTTLDPKISHPLPSSGHNGVASGTTNVSPPPRYAQIRSKPKTGPLASEFQDSTNNSPRHVYSELGRYHYHHNPHPVGDNENLTEINGSCSRGGNHSSQNGQKPVMCDYTEPKDVQSHVYAELNSFPTHVPSNHILPQGQPYHHNKTFCAQRPRPVGKVTQPPKVPIQKTVQGSTSPVTQQRPLPSIPPPFSTATLQ